MQNANRGDGLIQNDVGPQCPNTPDDVKTVQHMLNICAEEGRFQLEGGKLTIDGNFSGKTYGAVIAFQRIALPDIQANACVEVGGTTFRKLCESLPTTLDERLLALLYLRTVEGGFHDLSQHVVQAMHARGIDTPLRQAHFLAQIGHESGLLRYRAELASGDAYEGRSDLGNVQPGDGRKFKGRGLIQLTGRANYAEYGRDIGREAELLDNPSLLETEPELCVDVAAWFWTKRNLNHHADQDDLVAVTKRINGGLNGHEARRTLLARAKALLL